MARIDDNKLEELVELLNSEYPGEHEGFVLFVVSNGEGIRYASNVEQSEAHAAIKMYLAACEGSYIEGTRTLN